MTLIELLDRFGDEDRCRDYLVALRWPQGVTCPRCSSPRIKYISTRHQYTCRACTYRFSVRAGTIFEDSKLSLTKWFAAVYLIGESKKGMSGHQLARMLKVTTKTAWFLTHRIRAAMTRVENDRGPLERIVEIDETFHGGKHTVRTHGPQAYGGNSKAIVLGAIERDGPVRMRVGTSRQTVDLHAFVKSMVADDAEAIYTDDLKAYDGIADENTRHETVNHTADEFVRGDVHTNSVESVWSLFKRSVIGSYHQLSTKHLDAYLGELAFRFNNRENPYLFRDTLLALIDADHLTYKALIQTVSF